ncbi:hypothetical protein OROGR_016772 [Orobanche gracilis]
MNMTQLLADAVDIVETVLGITIDPLIQPVDLISQLKALFRCFPKGIDLHAPLEGLFLESQDPDFQAMLEGDDV